jgi:hypothetical protein
MRACRIRQLAVLLMLGCAVIQPAIGSTLVASALTFGLRASGHDHSVALRPDGHHVDVVLSHTRGEPDDPSRNHPLPVSLSQGDHVVHITAGDVVPTTFRRSLVASTAALGVAVALPVAPVSAHAPSRSLEVRASGLDHMRTVVLRL